jgi:hypothetical protein
VLHGSPGADLSLDGLFVSGGDIVLRGDFRSVTLTCCTLDPGSAGESAGSTAVSADGRLLVPTRLWIEASVASLTITGCITGPIRIRGGGAIETMAISDSIVQAIVTDAGALFTVGSFADPARLIRRLQEGTNPIAGFVSQHLSPGTNALLAASPSVSIPTILPSLRNDLNALIAGPALYDAIRFANEHLRPAPLERLSAVGSTADPILNRMLLEDAFPIELAEVALALDDGSVALERCTLLGGVYVHRMDASECILLDFAVVDDLQAGCMRFSAIAAGSAVPQQYECVLIPPRSPLFTSSNFGQPGYGQLLLGADSTILPTGAGAVPSVPSILRGAENGSEMGAFACERGPIKERGLLIKFQEFMPTGLAPVLVYVT